LVYYRCKYCGRVFHSKQELLQHAAVDHQLSSEEVEGAAILVGSKKRKGRGEGGTPPPPSEETKAPERPRVDSGAERPSEEALVRSLVSDYTPVVRKVVMNPRILMYYDYARSQGYDGDLGDFINEVVEGYFKERGIKIVVLRGVAEVGAR